MKAMQEEEECNDGGGFFAYAPTSGYCRCCLDKDKATTKTSSSSTYNIYETVIEEETPAAVETAN